MGVARDAARRSPARRLRAHHPPLPRRTEPHITAYSGAGGWGECFEADRHARELFDLPVARCGPRPGDRLGAS